MKLLRKVNLEAEVPIGALPASVNVMQIPDDLTAVLIVVLLGAVLVYKIPAFKNKQLGYLSIEQILYLVVIPGILLPLILSYVLSLTRLPFHREAFIPDGLLLNGIFLSLMFAYGGIAIHAVAKMMSHPDLLRFDESEAGKMNKFFHLKFSHNLAFGGLISAVMCMTLLEVNHVPVIDEQRILAAVVKGIMLAIALLSGMFFYTRSDDRYSGRWADLKFLFVLLWLGIMLILYTIRRIDPTLTDYQLLLPALFSESILGFLNMVLVVRRLKRGGFQVKVRWRRLKQMLSE